MLQCVRERRRSCAVLRLDVDEPEGKDERCSFIEMGFWSSDHFYVLISRVGFGEKLLRNVYLWERWTQ